MATVLLGDIKTEPHAKMAYNAPSSEKERYHLTIANRMGWAIKTTNMKRLSVEPPAVLFDLSHQRFYLIFEGFDSFCKMGA